MNNERLFADIILHLHPLCHACAHRYAADELREDEDFVNAATEVIAASTKWRAAAADATVLRAQLVEMSRLLDESRQQVQALETLTITKAATAAATKIAEQLRIA